MNRVEITYNSIHFSLQGVRCLHGKCGIFSPLYRKYFCILSVHMWVRMNNTHTITRDKHARRYLGESSTPRAEAYISTSYIHTHYMYIRFGFSSHVCVRLCLHVCVCECLRQQTSLLVCEIRFSGHDIRF